MAFYCTYLEKKTVIIQNQNNLQSISILFTWLYGKVVVLHLDFAGSNSTDGNDN